MITIDIAWQAIEKAERAMAGHEFEVSSRAVMDLVARSDCSAYDCEFIALAREQRVPLVTVDPQLLRAFPQVAISLRQFVKT